MAWVSKDTAKGRAAGATYVYYRVKQSGPDGRARVLASFRRKPEAYAFLDRLQRVGPEALAVPRAASGTLVVEDLARRYLEDRFPEYVPDQPLPHRSHLRQAHRVLERFKAAVGAQRPAVLLCADDVKLFHRSLVRSKLAAASVHSMLGYLSVFLRWAHKEKLVPELIAVERRDPKVRKPALSWDEAVAILGAAASWPEKPMKGVERGRLVPILATFLYTGIRRGELCTLQWRDIESLDAERPLLHVRYKPKVLIYQERTVLVDGKRRRVVEEVVGPWTPKGKTNRAIPILPPLARQLRAARPTKARPEDFVFTSVDRKPFSPGGLTSLLRRFAAQKLDRNLGTHIWRHTTATLLASRVSSFAVQAVLGHASLATTQKYVAASANLALVPDGVLPDAFAPAAKALLAEPPKTLPAPPECDDEVIGLAERAPQYGAKGARRKSRRDAKNQLTLWEPVEA